MALKTVRCWAAIVLVTLANPASSAVVGYDAQGAFLGVSDDIYLGGKYGGKLGMRPPATSPLATMPSTSGIPAVDPMILFAAAMVVLLLVLANDDGDNTKISDTIRVSPPPPPTLVPPGAPPLETRPSPVAPTPVPLPSGLALILAALGGLALARRRRD
ncbi:MAG: VPLPA-CTERM sorting domain-containing protein [Cyclobacteriaceae bacterium]